MPFRLLPVGGDEKRYATANKNNIACFSFFQLSGCNNDKFPYRQGGLYKNNSPFLVPLQHEATRLNHQPMDLLSDIAIKAIAMVNGVESAEAPQ